MSNCELFVNALAMGAGTLFWAWYLVYEYEVYKGIRKPAKWLGYDVTKLFRRGSDVEKN